MPIILLYQTEYGNARDTFGEALMIGISHDYVLIDERRYCEVRGWDCGMHGYRIW